MKKITLVLCACAMAFAGLLVSCSNDAGGDAQIIFRDNASFDYAYTVSGTKVVTLEDAADDPATLKKTTTTTTTFNAGNATISWNVNDDETDDYVNYSFWVNAGRGDEVVNVKTTGTGASGVTDPKDEHTDNINANDNGDTTTIKFYSLNDKYYLGSVKSGFDYNNNYSLESGEVWYAAKTDDEIKDLTETISVTGNIEEGDSITIVKTVVQDGKTTHGYTSEKSIYKTTTVYTYKLTKLAAAE